MSIIGHLRHPHEFKRLCDGLLRIELGPLTQTFAASGRDGGVDAEFVGTYGGISGRWTCQYKYVDPTSDPNAARQRLTKLFDPRPPGESEFAKVKPRAPAAYLLVTTAPATTHLIDRLTARCAADLPGCRLVIWDPSALECLLQGREFLARALDSHVENVAREQVLQPVVNEVEELWAIVGTPGRVPLWPLSCNRVDATQAVYTFSGNRKPGTRWSWLDSSRLHTLAGARSHPLYDYTARVRYPKAFRLLTRLLSAAGTLRNAVAAELASAHAVWTADTGPLGKLTAGERETLGTLGLYTVLANAWGAAEKYCNTEGSAIKIDGDIVYSGQHQAEVLRLLETELTRRASAGPPAAIASGRRLVERHLAAARTALWYPWHLWLDSP